VGSCDIHRIQGAMKLGDFPELENFSAMTRYDQETKEIAVNPSTVGLLGHLYQF